MKSQKDIKLRLKTVKNWLKQLKNDKDRNLYEELDILGYEEEIDALEWVLR